MSETGNVTIQNFKMSLTFIPIIGTGPISISSVPFNP